MKSFPLLCLFLTANLFGQDESKPGNSTLELRRYQKEFSNLPREERRKLTELHSEAVLLFGQKRIFECLEVLNEAEKIFENMPEIFNLRGGCYLNIRAFDKALNAFERGLELEPDNESIAFNIAETYFYSKQWKKSHDMFLEGLSRLPDKKDPRSRFYGFKLLLCKLKLGLDHEAALLAEEYDYTDDSPFHYYAKAAILYSKGEKAEASQWIARAQRIFSDPSQTHPWRDAVAEFGDLEFLRIADEESIRDGLSLLGGRLTDLPSGGSIPHPLGFEIRDRDSKM